MKISSHLLRFVFTAIFFAVAVQADENSRVYVVFKERQKATAKALVQQAAGQIHYEFDELRAIATTLPVQALDGLSRNPNIELIEEDPPRFMLGQVIPYGIDMVQARSIWDTNPVDGLVDAGALSGAGIKVGVIDSGVYIGHEDLSSVYASGRMTGNGLNGSSDPSQWGIDGCAHGTHVVGTIVAQANSLGVVGVSPGVSIHMARVFG